MKLFNKFKKNKVQDNIENAVEAQILDVYEFTSEEELLEEAKISESESAEEVTVNEEEATVNEEELVEPVEEPSINNEEESKGQEKVEEIPEENLEEKLEETTEDVSANKVARRKRRCKIFLLSILSFIVLTFIVYGGGILYFGNHFFFNTSLNGHDVSFKSVANVHDIVEEQVMTYSLTIHDAEGEEWVITGSDINIGYKVSEDVASAMDLQKAHRWPLMFFKERIFLADISTTFDEEQLLEKVMKMDFAMPVETVKPVNAYPVCENGTISVVDEVYGNQLIEDVGGILNTYVNNLEEHIYLLEAKAYEAPEVTKDSPEIEELVATMTQYMEVEIRYNEGDKVDKNQIATWISVDAITLEINFDEDKVEEYVKTLEDKYNTYTSTLKFTNPVGKEATVTGGDFGYRVNKSAEAAQIVEDILGGRNVSRAIKYSQTASATSSTDSPFGDTYVCLDLTLQKVYMLYKGSVVLTSDVVTGNVAEGNATPQGVYTLSYKTKDAVLRGSIQEDGTYGYESPVSYWMPFNDGIGFHDASWRSEYGGSIYKTNGSHGCVNMPLENAAKLYNYINSNMAIVCHY